MWKVLFLLAGVAILDVVISCDDDTPDTTTTESPPPCGCGGHHPPRCGNNQVYNNCSDPVCRPLQCSELGFPLDCDKQCKPGCICKEDYALDCNGVCIPIKDCPSCGGDKNAQSGCGNNCGKTCATYKIKNPICSLACILNGCDCRDGFVHDPNVKACVRPKDCTPTCKTNEEYSPCANGGCGPKNCSQVCEPDICVDPKECIKGCVCIKGYLRASNGTCVPKNKCPPPDCPTGEVWDTCPTVKCEGDYCPKTRDSPQTCPVGIVCDPPRCVCGYNRKRDRKTGKCIPIPDCPPFKCDCNEEYVACPSSCPGEQCSDYVNKTKCPPYKIGIIVNCRPQCRCIKDYYRNADGKCIPACECSPPICPKNEEYYNCSGGCTLRRCSELGFPLNCEDCTPGCVCKGGNVRADDGTCIPILDCPSCGGDENAQQGCGTNCGRTCSTYKNPPTLCPIGCIFNGCTCRKDFVYDDNIKKCVKPEDCTPICQANEEYSSCVNGGCVARNCSQMGKPVPCVKIDPKYCIKGCVCVEGYLRASNGTCVPKDQCTPKCDKPNEVYDVCPAPCPPRRCDVDEAVIKCAPPPKPGSPDCKPGCRCADHYYRNATGTCVLKKNCEKPLKCECPNEYYDPCPAICPPQKCGVNPAILMCMRNPEYGDPNCRPSCVCIDGYVRNDDNECIPKDECPQKCGKNEHWEPCYYNCSDNESCDDTGKSNNCPPGVKQKCQSGCRCDEGYRRNADNVCIPECECPPICQANEEYSSCVNGGCVARNCSQMGKPVPCVKIDPKYCIKGCVCVKGYLRASNGTCVPKDQCTPKCDKPNEVYDVCPAPCPPRRCDVDEAVIKCAPPPKPGSPDCKPGCRCADHYYRNATGTCVLKKNCEKPLKCECPNEYYDPCPAICPPQKCGVNPAILMCMRNPEYGDPNCRPSCVCIDGYVRNDDNECIPKDECPQKCGKNEHWEPCYYNCSDNESCDDTGKSNNCPPGVKQKCQSGCRCDKGYRRNADNVCIPECECPKPCGKNEHWDKCYYNCGGNQTCADIGKSYSCPAKVECQKGCRCDEGYWRNKDNVCIPESECPPPDCPCGEIWSKCPTVKCDGDYCPKTRDSPQTCPVGIVCDKPRCVCGVNRKRDWKTGKCIPITDCPKFKCDCNEEYQACPPLCPGEKCSDYINGAKCPPGRIGILLICRPTCKCIKGYYRDCNGICIPACNCK